MYLTINSISFALNSTFKINGLSLEVDKGEMIGIIGPNGSGKTTLLKLIAGVIKPHSGTIVLDNRDMHRLKQRALARIRAYVPEAIDLPFDYTVYEMTALGRHPYTTIFSKHDEKDKIAINNALELTDIKQLSHRRFFTLSMGEKQRALLAMAIAQEPELLLLDEPISHLDIGHQLGFMNTLKSLHRNGITIISAMHELPIAMEFFERLCLLDNGCIVTVQHPESKELVKSIKQTFHISDERFIVRP